MTSKFDVFKPAATEKSGPALYRRVPIALLEEFYEMARQVGLKVTVLWVGPRQTPRQGSTRKPYAYAFNVYPRRASS